MKLNRFLFPGLETRILVGIISFITIMILIGWVAINEPSRMASFEQQATARSIERGGELFAANCATCHNPDGRGQGNRAPGLNNPHLFGFNFLTDINGQIAPLERQIMEIREDAVVLDAEREALFDEVTTADADRQAEILARIEEINTIMDPGAEESMGSRLTAFEAELVPLYEEREALLASLDTVMLKGYYPSLEEKRAEAVEKDDPRILTAYLNEDASRLAQVGWGGDVAGYLTTTLIHGRPGSEDVWGDNNIMVAWSQEAGGPLRRDQIGDIVNYLLNWDKGDEWAMADLSAVNQFGKLHADASLVGDGGGGGTESFGTDTVAGLAFIADEGIVGDAARGELLYTGQESAQAQPGVLACSSCHAGGAQAPATEGTWSRTQNERLTLPELADYTVEQYLAESIVAPNDYIADSYSSGIMPQQYGTQLSHQDVADILAYLEAQG